MGFPGWVVAGCGASAAGVSAAFGAVPLPEAGLPGVALVGFVVGLEAGDATAAELAGARSEAGRALTPWRYASAMAVTIRT